MCVWVGGGVYEYLFVLGKCLWDSMFSYECEHRLSDTITANSQNMHRSMIQVFMIALLW